ncbi:hypothetical protein MLD38_016689 [Melastoma candidum]|uniref:Uncharacterized protein n=1 Tax=Melastoma candidum TaxID=119954 RepID=A0ACB9QPH0_9MYRT|nr:hypothetical protein MLD38_016689 [Melastoma candidum]
MEEIGCDLELGLRLGVGHRVVEEPTRAAANEAATGSGRSPRREHLTILYKGDVCVYENVSEAQAKAIMLLACCGERPRRGSSGFDGVGELSLKPGLPVTREMCRDESALMMKRSLQRFLEKRKTRMRKSSGCPY